MSGPERRLAGFVAGLEWAALPDPVRDEARRLFADTLGVTVAGSRDPDIPPLARESGRMHPGPAPIVGTEWSTTPVRAALANGISSAVLELNAGHKYAAGHPVVQYLPALLADSVANPTTPEAFLAAHVAGYEASARVGRASVPLAPGYHPFGVWGTVGAAAAVARHRGFDERRTLAAIQLAANRAQHTRLEAISEGESGARNGPVGFSNVDGLLAADLAEAGFGGITHGIERHLESTTRDGADRELLADRLGEHWEIRRGYYKRHSAGRLAHPAIEAVCQLLEEADITSDEVASIQVETFEKAATWLDNPAPTNRFQAKTSIPFAVATVIANGTSGPSAFDESALTEGTLSLAERVQLSVDPSIDARVPESRGARVRLELADRRQSSAYVPHADGGPNAPYTTAELEAKFERLVEPVLGTDRARALWNGAMALPESDPGRLYRSTGTEPE